MKEKLLYSLNERMIYQQHYLAEHHHILNSNKKTAYYKEELKKIYKTAILNFKYNKTYNLKKLFKNSNNYYQEFIIKNPFQTLDEIKIYIAIDECLSEHYVTISSNEYDNLFSNECLPLFLHNNKNGLNYSTYSIIIELNIDDIMPQYLEYNLGALYHEFMHIYQIWQNYDRHYNIAESGEFVFKIFNLLNDNVELTNLNNTDLMKDLSNVNKLNFNEILFILACCAYYCDYSEKDAHLQNISAEFKRWQNKIQYDFNLNRKNILQISLLYSNTYKKYWYLYKITKAINDKVTFINEDNIKKVEKEILPEYNINIKLNFGKNFKLTFKNLMKNFNIILLKTLQKANKIINDLIN